MRLSRDFLNNYCTSWVYQGVSLMHRWCRCGIKVATIAGVFLSIVCGCASLNEMMKRNTGGADEYMGGKAIAEQKKLIKKHIEDPDKTAALLAIVDDIDRALLDFDETQTKPYRKTLNSLMADQKATREDFMRLAKSYNEKTRGLFQFLKKKMFEMKSFSTPEEWAKISQRKTSVIDRLN